MNVAAIMPRVAHIFGRKLAEAREKLSLTQRELGEAIGGVSDETISRVERHEVAGILAKRLPRLAVALGMTLEQLRADLCPPDGPAKNATIPFVRGLPAGLNLRRFRFARSVPEFPDGVAASRRVDKLADHPESNRLVASTDRRAFTTPVDGDCQHPKWKHGEIVIFSYDAVDREGILPGKSYYIAFIDGSATFKRVFPDDSDPERYILRCWNRKKYPADQRVHQSEIVRIARAISKQVTVAEEE